MADLGLDFGPALFLCGSTRGEGSPEGKYGACHATCNRFAHVTRHAPDTLAKVARLSARMVKSNAGDRFIRLDRVG